VVGLIGEELFPKGVLAGYGWKVLPPQEALTTFLEAKEAEADTLLVLSHLGNKGDLALAREVKQSLLIFGAHTRTPLLSRVSESGSLIFRPRDRGTHLVEAPIERTGNSGKGGRIDFVDARLLEQYKKKRRTLADEIKGMDEKKQRIYERALESYDKAIREGERKRKVHVRMIPLDRSIAEDTKITAMLGKYKKQSASIARTSENPPATKSDYRGHASCSPCHDRNFAAWRQDAHSRAFETLKKQGDHTNPDCIGCHVTGYRTGGFLLSSPSPSRDFEGVGCESCHGPGKGHPGKRMAIPGEQTCAPCHVGLGLFPFEKKHHFLGCVRLRSL